MPRQLSGGQQQRVALARALAHQPDVLLLDEQLGALDAKIRIDLRRNLKNIQRKLGIAAIFVTHDQEEAFDLADRVGIMSFGRLIETGTPEDLYQRPQTEFVASFLGTANLLLGNIGPQGVKVGPLHFPLQQEIQPIEQESRVQVLFRPEDVALAPEPQALTCPQLGQAEVEEVTFGGAYERLRLRLPPIPNVRPIAPPVPFGSRAILVEATRPPEQALRFPLECGSTAWVGVHRIHALAHPGLSFLIVTDGSLRAQAAIELGGQLARLAHARVTLLGCAESESSLEAHLQEARKQLGSGLAALETHVSTLPPALAVRQAVEQQPVDMVVLGFAPQEDIPLAAEILEKGEHHLLLVPAPQPAPSHALICVSSGEPGKDDVLFAGRLVRHLGADAALMSVLSPANRSAIVEQHTQRFLDGGVQSLELLGVPARTLIRRGSAADEIRNELRSGDYDLLVLGAPLADERGQVSLSGVVEQALSSTLDCAALIVRSHFFGEVNYPILLDEG
jgi:nucleotide-binding universal stress UspA family protein/CheY-like chemotaxis protein